LEETPISPGYLYYRVVAKSLSPLRARHMGDTLDLTNQPSAAIANCFKSL